MDVIKANVVFVDVDTRSHFIPSVISLKGKSVNSNLQFLSTEGFLSVLLKLHF